MKNLILFYLVILLPLVFLIYLAFNGYSTVFGIGILIYALLYRPIVDGIRLIEIGRINKSEYLTLFVPFRSMKWFKSLYFER